ncbi:MAG: DUF2088 domain-containing protein [Tissierellia bacterium]|jgi:hypothetical protein|nr:DUF2088 domain-containing protein [Tissierellia bacterium]
MKELKTLPILVPDDYKYELPKMHKIRQTFNDENLENVKQRVIEEIQKEIIASKIKKNQRIAVAVGSRGINNLFLIVKTVIEELKKMGADPFIVSAMGSHGGGSEEGQKEVLDGYGITKENLGVDVITTVDVEKIGETSKGFSVYFDKVALGADLIIPINRIKLHTDFVGDLQSGLCKMLVIGLGNHIGCSSIHEEDPKVFASILEEATEIILSKANVGFGVGIIENAYDKTLAVEAVPRENLILREKELLKIAKKNMPILSVNDIDVLIVEEIGKNISGAGYDPNILGKSSVLEEFVLHVPKIQKMVLLDITDVSHGNGIGVGLFDVITKNVFEKLDLESMYANAIACKCIEDAKIPIMVDTEDECIRVALKACRGLDFDNLKIARIKNTLDLEYIYVSEGILKELDDFENIQICENN